MNNASNFALQVHLSTPIVLSQDSFFTLDSLLANLMVRQGASLLSAHTDIPLERTKNVWHASAVFLENALLQHDITFLRSLKQVELRKDLFINAPAPKRKANGAFGPQRAERSNLSQQRGDYKATLDKHKAFDTDFVCWYGRGDVAQIEGLLQDMHFVGKKARQGFGQVTSWDLFDVPEDLSLWRSVQGRDIPMRPIPVEVWQEDLGKSLQDLSIGLTACEPPYFESPHVRSVLPPRRKRFWPLQA